ncbi:MAG: Hsp20/alpha crystallin family protein [Candidatus Spechtbacterales bacterium]|nr:Hsp20/alpha crystallin family protein [Candidatus Spechtbacterales bacterium]
MDFFEKLGKKLNLEDEENQVETASVEEGDFYVPDVPEEEDGSGAEEVLEDSQDGFERTPDIYNEEEEEEEETSGVSATLAMAKASSKTSSKPTIKNSSNEDDIEVGRLTIDVYESDDEIIVKSIIAGVNADDLDIHITSDSVSIRGERSRDNSVENESYFYQECFWGAFSRSVILPTEIDPDKADATLDNGILTIKLPKLTKTQQKKLKVKKVS